MRYDKTLLDAMPEGFGRGPWTIFWDMHSGGSLKTPYHYILIQAGEDDATAIFGALFDQNPNSVACNCCGQNYCVSEYENFTAATGFHRALAYDKDKGGYIEGEGQIRYDKTVATPIPAIVFANEKDVCVIFASEIAPDDRSPSNVPDAYYDYSDDYYDGDSDDD